MDNNDEIIYSFRETLKRYAMTSLSPVDKPLKIYCGRSKSNSKNAFRLDPRGSVLTLSFALLLDSCASLHVFSRLRSIHAPSILHGYLW